MIEVCLLLLIYIFFTNFCVSVLLVNSFFYFSAIHLILSVFACMCERERRGILFLPMPHYSLFIK